MNCAMRAAATIATAMLLFAGCASTSIPFMRLAPDYSELPAAALQTLAEGIETAVAQEDRDYVPVNQDGVTVGSEAIRQAIRQRAARRALVVGLLDAGHASEMASGMIALQTGSTYAKATNKRERDRNALVVYSENQNRWTIYEGIVKASNFPPRSLSAVQDSFFRARLQHLKPEHKRETAPSPS